MIDFRCVFDTLSKTNELKGSSESFFKIYKLDIMESEIGSNDNIASMQSHSNSETITYDTFSAIRGLLILVVICIPGMLVNMKFLDNLKKEERKENGKILQRVLKNSAIAQMTFWPFLFFTLWLIKTDKLLIRYVDPCLYRYFGLVLRFLYFVFRFYLGFNSFVVATCRLCLIVYEEYILMFGLFVFRKIILYGSVLVPLIIVVLAECTIPISNYDKYLATEDLRCTKEFTNSNDTKIVIQSPIFSIVENHVNTQVIMVVKVLCYSMSFILLSNVAEGIMYFHTWLFIIR